MKENYQIPLILGIIIVNSVFIIQADAQIIVEKSDILRTGLISTVYKNFQLSPNFHVRLLDDTQMRISGTTIGGSPFYIVEEIVGDSIETRGTIVDNGKKIPFFYKTSLIEEEKSETLEAQKDAGEIFLDVTQPHNTRTGKAYVLTARVSDSIGPIEGASVDVTLTNFAQGKELTKISGLTDANGFFATNFLIKANTPGGRYDVKVEASYGQATDTQNLKTFVFATKRR